jgi:oxygen-independent coproporphyrinogen-3 oxidase
VPFLHVYVHVPFCARRCTYCDFAIAVRRSVPVRDYLAALATEARLSGDASAARTLYLGGGTPSQLGGDGIVELARKLRAPAGLEEFTLEANPDDVSETVVSAWRRAGLTRLSIGAQSFHPAALAWMHRTHDADATAAAVHAARRAGVGSLSLDLIFALPDSLGRSFPDDLDRLIALEPDHVSLYGLTVEPKTPLGRQVKRGDAPPVDEARYAEEYLLAHDRLGAAGYRFYEVSNAAREGHEAVHNAAYWSGAPYLGLGPSAHSFDGRTRWWNEPAYAAWSARLANGQSPVVGRETLDPAAQRLERLYLGLRTGEGAALEGSEVASLEAVRRWAEAGWAKAEPAPDGRVHVTLTPSGWLRLDELVAAL